MKKGFTLIELLAVIIILAVIALIATPIVLNVIDSAKRSANEASIRGYGDAIKLAVYEHQFASNGAIPEIDKEWALNNVKKGGNDVTCSEIKYNTSGVIMKDCTVKDDDKSYCFASGKLYDDCSSKEFLDIYNNKPSKLINKCTYPGEMVQGAEYKKEAYIYRYKQIFVTSETASGNIQTYWDDISEDGWAVHFNIDYANETEITTPICSEINGKPVVFVNNMFFGQADELYHDGSDVPLFKATSINLKGFDTSRITDMNSMFYFSQATSLDLSEFDTSNVTNMSNMFSNSKATSLDLSNFDTSKVTNMDYMFLQSPATTGYARTGADADKFNSSILKPSTLTFVVKPN